MFAMWSACKKPGKMAEPGLKAFALREKHRTGIYSFETEASGTLRKIQKTLSRQRSCMGILLQAGSVVSTNCGSLGGSRQAGGNAVAPLRKLVEVSVNGQRLDQLTPKAERKSPSA